MVVTTVDDSTANSPSRTATISHRVQSRLPVVGGDDNYHERDVPLVTVIAVDNDGPGVSLDMAELSIPEGEVRNYRVRLNTRPTHDVTVRPTIAPSNGLVTVDPTALTIRADRWSDGHQVRVRAVANGQVNGPNPTISHALESQDDDYNSDGLTVAPLPVTVIDDDRPAGVTVSTPTLRFPEPGGEQLHRGAHETTQE